MFDRLFILEIGRPIRQDAETQLGKAADDVLSITRPISELEIPNIAAEAYRRIMKLAQGGNIVGVVLSGPLALAFEIGQALGMMHAKVILYQFMNGRYVEVPPITRQHLFQSGQ